MPPKGGLIYPTLPANATQVDYGAEAYRLVCSACHGDVGQGLTSEWLATWNPADQNCWQSKCHAASHPQDGFELPHYVPAIIGPGKLAGFRTAQDLHDYIERTMPWQDPGYLQPEEYWNISAFLVRANGIDPMLEPLTVERAGEIMVNESEPTVRSEVERGENLGTESIAQQPAFWAWVISGLLLISGGVAGLVILGKRGRR